MTFNELLASDDFIIADGAQGTLLYDFAKAANISFCVSSELAFSAPDVVSKAAKAYLEVGSRVICANTFGASRLKLEPLGLDFKAIITENVRLTKAALGGGALVALDVAPLGEQLAPLGTMSFEEAYDLFREIMATGEEAGADLILAETFSDLLEAKAAVLAAKENTRLPVIISMTYEPNGRTFTGTPPSAAALTLGGLGADVIGVNCSLGPADLLSTVREMLRFTDKPVMVKPNAGLPDPTTGVFALTAAEFAKQMKLYAELGVKMLGGCCGTTPQHIAHLINATNGFKPTETSGDIGAVCSAGRVVTFERPRMVGERINPTGKPLFKSALTNGDTSYAMRQAVEQQEAGAEILDINTGLAGIDEAAALRDTVLAVQSVCDLPLQLDSAKAEALEQTLRVYNGKPLVNSVNGDPEVLERILPLVAKYGAAVVGLCLDKDGIPDTAAGRLEIAKRIIEAAETHGIPRDNVIIDCLTLTIGAGSGNAAVTLDTLSFVKKQLGVKTTLGVSNISFGLPNREGINAAFLTLALDRGLTLPIVNPNIEAISTAFRAFAALNGHADEYAEVYSQVAASPKKPASSDILPLFDAVACGLTADATQQTAAMIDSGKPPLQIADEFIIPALDEVGTAFGKGKMFLPQLIKAADAASACFELIRGELLKSGVSQNKGVIVLATVKGDVHDIGKNIVKVLLESYGFAVIDLGRDVPPEKILTAAKEHSAFLVGLSALMTTTLPAMEETVRLLKANLPHVKTIVGGAVLSEEYAKSIGADFYAKDAKEGADIAQRLIK